MTTAHLQTKLEIKSWDEDTVQELPGGQKLNRSTVALVVSDPGLAAEASMSGLLHYLADQTSSFVSLVSIEGRLGERTGTVVLQGTGTYDGAQARVEFTIIPGSGTGELAGIRGTGVSVSTHADYPFMPLTLDYELG